MIDITTLSSYNETESEVRGMQISSRFTIAVHIFACIDTFEKDHKITSEFLAESVNVNPVIIRKILSSLKKSHLIEVQRGTGGASIAKSLEEITLYDICELLRLIEVGASRKLLASL